MSHRSGIKNDEGYQEDPACRRKKNDTKRFSPKSPEKASEPHKIWYVYMLRCGDGSLYTGISPDVFRRLARHQSGKGSAYTRSHLPVSLVYVEKVGIKGQALRREAEIKRMKRVGKLELISAAGNFSNSGGAQKISPGGNPAGKNESRAEVGDWF